MLLSSEAKRNASEKLYFIGVGCNIEPEINVPAIIQRLVEDFTELSFSRLCYTEPVGMVSDQLFVNFVIAIRSSLHADEIKNYCNQVEQDFGRDRSHPDRKSLDRRADLDIIHVCDAAELMLAPVDSELIVDEHFLRPMFDELQDFLREQPIQASTYECLTCRIGALTLGQVPATIHLEASSGNIVVVEK